MYQAWKAIKGARGVGKRAELAVAIYDAIQNAEDGEQMMIVFKDKCVRLDLSVTEIVNNKGKIR